MTESSTKPDLWMHSNVPEIVSLSYSVKKPDVSSAYGRGVYEVATREGNSDEDSVTRLHGFGLRRRGHF